MIVSGECDAKHVVVRAVVPVGGAFGVGTAGDVELAACVE